MAKKKGEGCLGIVIWGLPILALLLVLFFLGRSSYNKMVSYEENAIKTWGQVEAAYQERYDLIPNLVETVKGYAAHENDVLTAVTEARSNTAGTNENPNLSEEGIEDFQAAQDEVSSTLSRLLVVVESYPDLKADAHFMSLINDLKLIEEKINVKREDYNNTVGVYNTYIRKFPALLYAKMFKFKTMGYFQASEGAEEAPSVEF